MSQFLSQVVHIENKEKTTRKMGQMLVWDVTAYANKWLIFWMNKKAQLLRFRSGNESEKTVSSTDFVGRREKMITRIHKFQKILLT